MSSITTRAGKGSPLTHNEVDANFTNLNSDKYEAGDSPSFTNVTVTGTVDGRDVAADGTKLDGIEAGATADQTAGEIKTAYESNADTNAFTDAEQSKLAGIEAGADVTDTANVTAAGALMDSELTDIAAVKALDQGVATTDSPDFAGMDLAAIAASKADTAVDVFVYDTSMDSDGGAWRKRTQHTSWYNETLNTATRGSRREFPAVAVIVAETDKVTIYDGDDPSLPMWMVFNAGNATGKLLSRGTNGAVKSIAALNGVVSAGTGGATSSISFDGLSKFDFVADKAERNNINGQYTEPTLLGLSSRNDDGYEVTTYSSRALVNGNVNDVAMTILPDAPIDPATGLPVPTIAVATDGGVSVIKDDGTVVDITNGAGDAWDSVDFNDLNRMVAYHASFKEFWTFEIPSADVLTSASGGYEYAENNIPAVQTDNTNTGPGLAQGPISLSGSTFVYAPDDDDVSLVWLAENKQAPATGMVVWATSTYNTGWMNGDIKGAFLSDTDDTDLVGGTDADRSVNGNDLTVNGTVTRSPVATGADLVAYSGFSASNYLEQPYNSDLDFGTGDFCVMGWFKTTSTSKRIINRQSADNYWNLYVNSTGKVSLDFISGSHLDGTIAINGGTWTHVAAFRESGVVYLYINGALDGSVSNAVDLDDLDAVLTVGIDFTGVQPFDAGSLALWRISATAPTAEQIKKIYEDEKFLFQENAQATLYGTSDAVTALAHDPVTDLLHVGTSAGRSVFSGLRRVDNTITAVGTAISASNGLVAEE